MYIVREVGVAGNSYGYSSLTMAMHQMYRLTNRARDSNLAIIRLYELNNNHGKLLTEKMEVLIYGNQEK